MQRQIPAASLLFALFACSSAPDYLATVMDFQERKNDGDLEAALELFTDEPSLHFGSLGTISGLNDVRKILEYDLALNTYLQFQNCEVDGLEVSCRVVETNDWLRTVDIQSIEYDENRFVFSADGRIESVNASLSAESAQSLGAVMAEFHQWATTNRPADYSELFTENGAFVYSAENADKVLILLRAWRDK